MVQTLKKLLSLVLVAALFVSVVPTQAFAVEETKIYLPEIEIGNDILDYDVFYLATAAASVEESDITLTCCASAGAGRRIRNPQPSSKSRT